MRSPSGGLHGLSLPEAVLHPSHPLPWASSTGVRAGPGETAGLASPRWPGVSGGRPIWASLLSLSIWSSPFLSLSSASPQASSLPRGPASSPPGPGLLSLGARPPLSSPEPGLLAPPDPSFSPATGPGSLSLTFRLAQSIGSGPPVSQPGAPAGAAGAGPAPGRRHGNATLPARAAHSRKPRRPVGAGGGACPEQLVGLCGRCPVSLSVAGTSLLWMGSG